jgi:hypothetical protein
VPPAWPEASGVRGHAEELVHRGRQVTGVVDEPDVIVAVKDAKLGSRQRL